MDVSSARRRCSSAISSPGGRAIRLEHPGHRPWTTTVQITAGRRQRSPLARRSDAIDQNDVQQSDQSHPRARERHDLRGRQRRRRRRDLGRGRVQHEPHRVSGSPHRSLVRGTDRDDDRAADRQLRRVGRGQRVARRVGRRLRRCARRRRWRATGAPTGRSTDYLARNGDRGDCRHRHSGADPRPALGRRDARRDCDRRWRERGGARRPRAAGRADAGRRLGEGGDV